MKKLISIVIPAYNEEDVVPELIQRITQVISELSGFEFEIIVVENGSYDHTLEKLLEERKKEKRLKILQLAKNEGCDGAIMAGLSFARGDAAIVMMADLQDTPELISEFIANWEKGFEIVYGIVKSRRGVAWSRRFGTMVFYKIINVLTHGAVPENVSDFRLLDRKVYEVLAKIPEHNKFFRGLALWTGYRHKGIAFERPPREKGESKANFLSVLNIAINGIISFSSLPLRISWVFAGLCLVFSLFSVVFLDVFTVILGLAFFSVFVILGIQAEYLGRIFEEVRQRPNFIVSATYGIEKE